MTSNTPLRHLSLCNLSLAGPLPNDLVDCRSLRFLYLDNNRITGPLPYYGTLYDPAEVPAFQDDFDEELLVRGRRLRVLSLGGNRLEGDVTDDYSRLTGLRQLVLSSNRLTSLPDLSKCTCLTKLALYKNPWRDSHAVHAQVLTMPTHNWHKLAKWR